MSKPGLVRSQAADLYETDFYAWGCAQARAIAGLERPALDIDNLIDEVESVGRSQRSAIEAHLRVLLIHLLKFRFQPERVTVSWRVTLSSQRLSIRRLVARSPSLAGYPVRILDEAYEDAVRGAAKETGLPEGTFPSACPFALAQILDPDFVP